MSKQLTPEQIEKDKKVQELLANKDDDGEDWLEQLSLQPFPEDWYSESPLFMDKITPETLANNATASAIHALVYGTEDDDPNEIAENFKNQGNNILKEYKEAELKKHLPDVLHFYSEGLKQKMTDMKLRATLHCNRAHVNLQLKNYASTISDSLECLKLEPQNMKALYRLVKAANALEKWKVAIQYSEKALKLEPQNAALLKEKEFAENGLIKKHELLIKQKEQQRIEKEQPKKVIQLLKSKNIKIGTIEFQSAQFDQIAKETGKSDLGGLQIDSETQTIFFNTIFIYDQFRQTDFVQQFSEEDTIEEHLIELLEQFPFGPPEDNKKYTLNNVKVFYLDQKSKNSIRDRYIEIDPKSKLIDILTQEKYYLPSNFMPIFHVVAKNTPTIKDFQ